MDESSVSFQQEGKISLAPGGSGGDEEAAMPAFGSVSLSAAGGGHPLRSVGGGSPGAAGGLKEGPVADAPLFGGGGGGGGGGARSMGPGLGFGAGSAEEVGGQASSVPRGSSMSQATQEAMQEVASQAMHTAGRAFRRGASEVRVYVTANPYSITLMSFFGGCWLILASLVTILDLGSLFTNTLAWILQGYQVFFGLIIIIIDGPADKLCIPLFLREKMLSYVSFMHNNKSRFIFYLFIACQQGSQPNWPSKLTGWYFSAVAAGFALVQLTAPPPPAAFGIDGEGASTALASAQH
mmetsp:Transcript_171513/g.544814  ORF Transcript_171513/g.544814 Transcript_171513/m.544814 type:complete len:295 (-) Transcript_171513:49-933(-)